jgi:hypothetical protein
MLLRPEGLPQKGLYRSRCPRFAHEPVDTRFLLIIRGQSQSRLRRSFALPAYFVDISEKRDFFGRVRLRPNRNRRTKFDVRDFAHEAGDTRFLLIIPGQPQSRLRRSFALPTNFVHIRKLTKGFNQGFHRRMI